VDPIVSATAVEPTDTAGGALQLCLQGYRMSEVRVMLQADELAFLQYDRSLEV
jgi:hypothetical protein